MSDKFRAIGDIGLYWGKPCFIIYPLVIIIGLPYIISFIISIILFGETITEEEYFKRRIGYYKRKLKIKRRGR
jgi:hypothetical protein